MARLCSELSERNHQVTLITLDNGSQDRHFVLPSVQRIRLDVLGQSKESNLRPLRGLRRVLGALRRIAQMRRTFKSISPDVILSFCDQMNVMTLIAATRTTIQVIICERSDPRHQRLPKFWERLRSATYPKASKVVALTDEVANHLRQYYRADALVIPSAIDVPNSHSSRDIATHHKTMIAIGRLEEEKGFERLIQAFAKIASQQSEWTLHIIGDGSMRNPLGFLIKQLKLEQRVLMTGWVAQPWEQYSNSTLFILPSLYEGFPSVLMEAMARGVPSISVDCDSGPRAIIDRVSQEGKSPPALLVSNDQAGLAAGMQKLMTDAKLREAIGQAGKEVAKQFGWTEMVNQYETLLLELQSGQVEPEKESVAQGVRNDFSDGRIQNG